MKCICCKKKLTKKEAWKIVKYCTKCNNMRGYEILGGETPPDRTCKSHREVR